MDQDKEQIMTFLRREAGGGKKMLIYFFLLEQKNIPTQTVSTKQHYAYTSGEVCCIGVQNNDNNTDQTADQGSEEFLLNNVKKKYIYIFLDIPFFQEITKPY